MNLEKSTAFFSKCEKVIPAGSSTLAKSPRRLVPGVSPFYVDRAKGSHFWDIDGNYWLDCEMAMGTVVWGHARDEITQAIAEQAIKGVHYSLPGRLEYQMAERLLQRYPFYGAAKFFKNGADAVYAAVRIARFLSKRPIALSCEYHGWLDWCSPIYYRCSPESLGIPGEITQYNLPCYGEATAIVEEITRYAGRLACVVLCPASYSQQELVMICEQCRQCDVLVIFDEVTSGMRFGKNGATGVYGIRPDFLCLSKGLANGLPLAVLLGCPDLLGVSEQLKISNAHAGENLSLAAAIACEDLLDKANCWPSWGKSVAPMIDDLSAQIREFSVLQDVFIGGSVGCFSLLHKTSPDAAEQMRLAFIRFLAGRGIYTKGYILFSDAHTQEEIAYVAESLHDFVEHYASIVSS